MKPSIPSKTALALGLGIGFTQAVQPASGAEEGPEYWFELGRHAVAEAKALSPGRHTAKNVILFVGDGMGVSTVTAARIFDGQRRGDTGEENFLSFEKLPYLALSKTYNTNQQTPDSAGTMTAMITGAKSKAGILSVDQNSVRGDCESASGHELTTFLELAEEGGLSTGVVTTARVTHATPAATYAHTPERDWEDDHDLSPEAKAAGCHDIARQLIEFPRGNGLEVVLGGGRRRFLPRSAADPEDSDSTGERDDGRNLTEEWRAHYPHAAYVWNSAQFAAVDSDVTDHLLGLFEASHMEYAHDRLRDVGGEPSLAEMTGKAIDILSRNRRGFFLHVEAGRIDHAHHAGNAYRALSETVELSRAVDLALEKTDPEETLIIVTADHSHVFTIAGYPTRGNPILGHVLENNAAGEPKADTAHDNQGAPYTTLGYANGPGARAADIRDPEHPDYLQKATVPLAQETHAGEDVAVYAGGPGAHLLHGVQEQNVIFHVMCEATGLCGPRSALHRGR